MVLSAHMHSHTLLAKQNAINSTHVQPQVTPGNACACPGRSTVAQKTAPMFAYYIKTHVLLNADII